MIPRPAQGYQNAAPISQLPIRTEKKGSGHARSEVAENLGALFTGSGGVQRRDLWELGGASLSSAWGPYSALYAQLSRERNLPLPADLGHEDEHPHHQKASEVPLHIYSIWKREVIYSFPGEDPL